MIYIRRFRAHAAIIRQLTITGRGRASLNSDGWIHDRSRTLFDQRSAGAAGRHLAKFDLRASALGESSERGPGLPAVHSRFGDHDAHRKIDDEGEPVQGLRPVTDVGAEVLAFLSVARRWQQISEREAHCDRRARSCALSEEAVDRLPLAAVTDCRFLDRAPLCSALRDEQHRHCQS